MKLKCYALTEMPVPIEPGRPERAWMDAFLVKQPYRCLPLTIANTSGWELLNLIPFCATWNGGEKIEDITIEGPPGFPKEVVHAYVVSHFGGGVLTFHTHFLFQTEPGWDLWVGGPPNHLKHGIQPLTGIVETTWLPQPFTMNWRFTAPGSVSFEPREPMALIMPVTHAGIDAFEPEIEPLSANPDLETQMQAWRDNRAQYIRDLELKPTEDWQKHYFKGRNIDDSVGSLDHIHRRRLKAPRKL